MAFGGGLNNDDDMVSDINMVPLIDVMLVLLIIFIITVPVLTHSVNLDLPRAANQQNMVKPQSIQLSVTADGLLHWNDEVVSIDQMTSRLQGAANQSPQPDVLIRGDRKVEYEKVAQVMAAVQRAGMLKLGFVTDPGI